MKTEPPKINWDRLRTLRDLFLSGEPIEEDYWSSNSLLQDYDITLGERIGWKWDAVIKELQLRGWTPPSSAIDDLGCGTGIAVRRMLDAYPGHFKKVTLYDRSTRAMRYAKQKIKHKWPKVKVVCAAINPPQPHGIVLISHVLTESSDETASGFMEQLENARGIIWVEPGTYAASRMLIEVRESLMDEFKVQAPCTHQKGCGMLTEGHETHWCHHFAQAVEGAHQDPFWGHFRKEMNLDIGPVAYSFLVMGREELPEPEGLSHLIGQAQKLPKFLKVLNCQESGIEELVAGKSSDRYRDLKKGLQPSVYKFERRKNRIVGGEHITQITPK